MQFGVVVPMMCSMDEVLTVMGNFGGGYGAAHCNQWRICGCAITHEVIALPFGVVSGVGSRKGVLNGPDRPWARGCFEGI